MKNSKSWTGWKERGDLLGTCGQQELRTGRGGVVEVSHRMRCTEECERKRIVSVQIKFRGITIFPKPLQSSVLCLLTNRLSQDALPVLDITRSSLASIQKHVCSRVRTCLGFFSCLVPKALELWSKRGELWERPYTVSSGRVYSAWQGVSSQE